MAERRAYVPRAFPIIFFPGASLALTMLAINLVGDGGGGPAMRGEDMT